MAVKRGGLAVYPIGSVMRQTGLTGRQIRYYEQMELIEPTRSKGNQRLYSDTDVETLIRIRRLLDEGYNIEGIRALLDQVTEADQTGLASDSEAAEDSSCPDTAEGSQSGKPQDIEEDNEYDGLGEREYQEIPRQFLRDRELVSLFPVNNRARLQDLLLTNRELDDGDAE